MQNILDAVGHLCIVDTTLGKFNVGRSEDSGAQKTGLSKELLAEVAEHCGNILDKRDLLLFIEFCLQATILFNSGLQIGKEIPIDLQPGWRHGESAVLHGSYRMGHGTLD